MVINFVCIVRKSYWISIMVINFVCIVRKKLLDIHNGDQLCLNC